MTTLNKYQFLPLLCLSGKKKQEKIENRITENLKGSNGSIYQIYAFEG